MCCAAIDFLPSLVCERLNMNMNTSELYNDAIEILLQLHILLKNSLFLRF